MSSIKTAISLLKTPGKMILPIGDKGLFNWIPDEPYLKFAYRGETGKKLDLNNPQTFNEKLQWLKLHDRNPLYHKLVDKFEVKDYVANKIGLEYIIPTLGVWDKVEEVSFNKLPDQFVLKCTHDSGSVVICQGKKTFDIETAIKYLTYHMKKSIYWFGREWAYKGLKPRIIAEPYMTDESGIELKDYKVHSFNGEPRIVQVDYGRYSNHKRNIYDCNWQYRDVSIKYPTDPNIYIQIPEKLDEMLTLARILSKGIPYVRVDFYSIIDKIYFGELTFYHGSGFELFMPESFGNEMGSWIELPEK